MWSKSIFDILWYQKEIKTQMERTRKTVSQRREGATKGSYIHSHSFYMIQFLFCVEWSWLTFCQYERKPKSHKSDMESHECVSAYTKKSNFYWMPPFSTVNSSQRRVCKENKQNQKNSTNMFCPLLFKKKDCLVITFLEEFLFINSVATFSTLSEMENYSSW